MAATSIWQLLSEQQHAFSSDITLKHLFAVNPNRFADYSIKLGPLLFDYSKHLIDEQVLSLLLALAKQHALAEKIQDLFRGANVNFTEQQPALHTALRAEQFDGLAPDIQSIISAERIKMRQVVTQLRQQVRQNTLTDIIHIGIGGSHLGFAVAEQALKQFCDLPVRIHQVTTIDGYHLKQLLKIVPAESTAVIVASKSFTTFDTIKNAETIKAWMMNETNANHSWQARFFAVSENTQAVTAFGIKPDNHLKLWPWVGGRFSISSSIGLPIAILLGMDKFEQMLKGMRIVDQHFLEAPFEHNIPVLMALLNTWYVNCWQSEAHAVLPYDQRLENLPAYLMQLEMESLGKIVNREGQLCRYKTAGVVLGDMGLTAQHSFMQQFHQGARFISTDFIASLDDAGYLSEQNKAWTLANCFAQSQALAFGVTKAEAERELLEKGYQPFEINQLIPHKIHHGNRPSSTILIQTLEPLTLGMIIALYEHKVYAQSVLWEINAFDQWGVELGKTLARKISGCFSDPELGLKQDSSTQGLLAFANAAVKANDKSHSESASQKRTLEAEYV